MTKFEPTHRLTVGDGSLHVVEAGQGQPESVIFLHGWPEDWTEWRQVMELASQSHHVVALDLPGVGKSRGIGPSGEKAMIAETVHQTIAAMGLTQYTLVGHDAGAMVAYAYLRKYATELRAAVLISSVIPGLAPWLKVVANPRMWHFGFHQTPRLPEIMVMGRQRAYFDYFFNILAQNHAAIDDAARDHYAAAYVSPEALKAGFDWYRAFEKDAETNRKDAAKIATPLLYLRGEGDSGDISEYVEGFHQAGIETVTAAKIPGSGHFSPEENPAAVWAQIAEFLKK